MKSIRDSWAFIVAIGLCLHFLGIELPIPRVLVLKYKSYVWAVASPMQQSQGAVDKQDFAELKLAVDDFQQSLASYLEELAGISTPPRSSRTAVRLDTFDADAPILALEKVNEATKQVRGQVSSAYNFANQLAILTNLGQLDQITLKIEQHLRSTSSDVFSRQYNLESFDATQTFLTTQIVELEHLLEVLDAQLAEVPSQPSTPAVVEPDNQNGLPMALTVILVASALFGMIVIFFFLRKVSQPASATHAASKNKSKAVSQNIQKADEKPQTASLVLSESGDLVHQRTFELPLEIEPSTETGSNSTQTPEVSPAIAPDSKLLLPQASSDRQTASGYPIPPWLEEYNNFPYLETSRSLNICVVDENSNNLLQRQGHLSRRQAHAYPVIFESQPSGKYWIISDRTRGHDQPFCYLLPRKGVNFNRYDMDSISDYFQLDMTQWDGDSRYKIIEPAIVNPLGFEEKWQLIARGSLDVISPNESRPA